MKDPYEAQRQACLEKGGHEKVKGHNICCCDDNVSVSGGAPLEEQKTQVERCREKIEENYRAMSECKNEIKELEDCEDCYKKFLENAELIDIISKDHEEKGRFIGRTPTGKFANEIPIHINIQPTDFAECDTCRSKPGTPTLCLGCLHNRNAIEKLKRNQNTHLLDKIKKLLQ